MSAKKAGTEAALRKTRFAQVPQWVANHPDVLGHPTALAVYVHLAILADYRTRVTTSDWHEITERTGWSKPTVMRAMKVLRDSGVIERRDDLVVMPMDQPPGLTSDTGPVGSSIKSDTGQDQIRDRAVSNLIRPPIYPEVNSEGSIIAPDGAKPTDDPLTRCSHSLAVKAMERTHKPKNFSAAMGVIKSLLKAGWSDRDLLEVIETRQHVVFTIAGLQAALEAQARERKSKTRERARPRSEAEIIVDQRAAYQRSMQEAAAEGRL